jgi:CRP-like cAMP-binding protein
MDGKVAALASVVPFVSCSPAQLRRLARTTELVDLRPRQTLSRAGTRNGGCYLLLDGALVTTTANSSWLVSTPGGFVGLAETVAGAPTIGDTVAVRPSTVVAFSPPALTSTLSWLPALHRHALGQLARGLLTAVASDHQGHTGQARLVSL